MTPQQWRRFVSWLCLSVGLPATTYLSAFVLSWLVGMPISPIAVLARGDLLLLAIALLAFGLDATVHHLLMTPRTQADLQNWHYFFVGIALLALILTAIVYGGFLVRSESAPPMGPSLQTRAILFFGWVLLVTGGVGLQYNRLLRAGII